MKLSTFLYVIFFFTFTLRSPIANGTDIPRAVRGILDLRQESLNTPINLNGEWKFYWKKLITPKDSIIFTKPEFIKFPFKWNGYILNGQKLPSFGYATYTLTIYLPKGTSALSILMPDTYSSYKLYINNKVEASNGNVSTTKDNFIPYWQPHIINIAPHTKVLDIKLQIANFAHSKGGITNPLKLGKKDTIELEKQQNSAIDLILTGCLIMSGLYFLGLYIMGNRDKAILIFALFSIIFSYRIIGIQDYVLHSILPGINWYITIRLEYITFFLGIGLFALYTYYLYPEDVNKLMVKALYFLCISFAILSAVLHPYYFTQLINPFLILMIFCLLYVPYIYTKAYKNNRPGSFYALLSTVAILMVFTISLLNYWGLIPALKMASFLCYISSFFLQSLVLSHRVSFELKKARKDAEQGLKSKSNFLSTMSHEIRTPLNSVIGMSHLLLRNAPRKDQVEHLDVMLFSANNLLSIVNDILDYTKIEAGKISFEHIDMEVASIARNIVKGLQSSAQDKGIELRLEIDSSLNNKVKGDPTRLYQVMTNLVHNAIKFTNSGHVLICIDIIEETATTLKLKFRIKDTGIGISKENHKLIFDRFTQADSSTSRGFGGTGLGLAICKKILTLQGSKLELISEEGKGSEFYFEQVFEISQSISGKLQQALLSNQENNPLAGIHILLVEDNPMNVLVAQSFLKRWGATIDVASNGLEAVKKVDVNKHHLILMDLHMPVMDGYEASAQIRKLGHLIPIIALTANLPNEIEEKVKNTGINDIVVKPFLPDELYRKILNHVSCFTV